MVQPGQTVTLAVEAAQDWDTRTLPDGTHSIARDTALTYTWSAQEQGHFLVTHPDGTQTQEQEATGTSAIWVAPDDVTEDTEVEVKCTIEDSEEELVVAPEAGSRDDEATVRSFTAKVVLPEVTFEEQSARACAGGVAVDGVHDFTIIGTAKDANGTLMPQGTEFKLSFENNHGENKRATFAADIEQGQAIVPDTDGEEMTVTTNAQGQFSLTVLSSDTISSDIKVKVKGTNPSGEEFDAGEQTCDFGAAKRLRNFPNPLDPYEDEDSGWLFIYPYLSKPGSVAPAKVYLKFKINANLADDWIDPDTGEDNWDEVNGHEMLIRVAKVELRSGETVEGTPEQMKDYGIVIANPGGEPGYPAGQPTQLTITRATSADGATTPQVYVKAGPKIGEVSAIYLAAKDLTQITN